MRENHIAHDGAIAPEAATNGPASPCNLSSPAHMAGEPVPEEAEPFAFASEDEANAYWAGVADGMRNAGKLPAPRLAARARDEYPEIVATAEQLRDRDILEFDPVSVRHRIDGWTPRKQREYVEALADSGVARYAAARVGMSEQSVNRLQRRVDARSFNLACEAAWAMGARRVRSVAFERAIEGTIKRHYYHGELKSEERVYDNRLLTYLVGKIDRLLEPPRQAQAVVENWQPWMEAIEQDLPAPIASDEAKASGQGRGERLLAESAEAEGDDFANCEVWEELEGEWRTNFPPPAGFRGYEDGEPGEEDYERSLTLAELRAIGADPESEAEALAEQIDAERAARDRYFGFAGDGAGKEVFSPREASPSEIYEPSDPPVSTRHCEDPGLEPGDEAIRPEEEDPLGESGPPRFARDDRTASTASSPPPARPPGGGEGGPRIRIL